MLIVLAMLVGAAPASLFAITASAEDSGSVLQVGTEAMAAQGDTANTPSGAIPTGTHWEKVMDGEEHVKELTCSTDEHTHSDSCYKTVLGKKVLLCYKTVHSHSAPACYSYKWKVVWNTYNVEFSISGKDGVVLTNVSETVQHSVGEFSCVVPAMGEAGWVATVVNDGVEKVSVPLNADTTTTVATKGLTSGSIEIRFSQATVYDIELTNTTPELGQASLSATKAIKGTVITVTATPKANTANTKYSLASIVVNGETLSGNTFTVGEEDVAVVVTFAKEQLSGNATANIAYDVSKTLGEQLDALKEEIFNKLAINYVPDGVNWDDLTYEHKYYETNNQAGSLTGANQNSVNGYAEIGTDPEDRSVSTTVLGQTITTTYTTHPFGYTGLGTVEHVRISYNGLVIEADVTLVAHAVLDIQNGTVKINGYYKEKLDDKVFDTLKADTLTAVGLTDFNAADYQVIYVTRLGEIDLDNMSTLDKTNFFATVEIGESGRSIKITNTATGASKTVSISIQDSRTEYANIEHNYVAGDFNTEDDFKDAVNAAIKVNGSVIETSLLGSSISYNKETDGTYTVTVDYAGDATYLPTTKTFEGITWTANQYTVTWVDGKGEVIRTDVGVVYGDTLTPPEVPETYRDYTYTYTFKEWSPAIKEYDGAERYTAIYDKVANEYTIVWKDGDITLETDTGVKYTDEHTYDNTNGTPAELAAKRNNAQYTYAFDKWVQVVDLENDVITYTASYTTAVNKYTVTFKNGDATLQSSDWEYGATPVYSGATPTKAADAQFTYVFSGWSPVVSPVTGAVTYQAQFNTTTNTYTVTWKNWDGTTLETDENIPYGQMPEFNGAEPTKPADNDNTYHFDGWEPTVDNVTGNVTYTAKFSTVAKIKVTFSVLGDTARYTGVVLGEKVSAYANPAVVGYAFDGWFADEACTEAFDFANTAITEAITVYAKMTKLHTVTFDVNGGAPTVGSLSIRDGEAASAPDQNPDKNQATFIGWFLNDELYNFSTPVTGDIALVAKYGVDMDNDELVDGSDEDPYLTYIWMDGETELKNQTVLSGATIPTYVIADQDDNGKKFVRWDKVVDGHITTYTAVWTDDANNNDTPDEDETVSVVLPSVGGSITIGGVTPDANGSFVFDTNNNSYDVVVTPPAGTNSVKQYVSYFAILDKDGNVIFSVGTKRGANAQTAAEGLSYVVSYNDGQMTVSGVALADGMSIDVEYAEHKIEANGNKEVSVNGYNSTTIYESLTKENVLRAILGDFYDPARIGEYTVTMTVGLAMIKDKLGSLGSILPDTFEADVFSDRYELLGIDITTYVKEILKGAFDINETEAIKVTWKSTEIGKPEVSANYTIKLRENRPSTTVTHNGGTYNIGSINGLLDLINGNLTSNVVISDVDWAEDYTNLVFEPGTTMTLKVKVTVIETAEFCGKEHIVEVTVYVPYTSVNATFSDNRDLIYNTGMSDADKSDLVLGVLDPKFNVPLVGVSPVVWYLASTEHTVPMEINFSEMDLGVYGTIIRNLLGNSITIQVPVKEMWLNIGDDLTIPEAPSNDLIESILLNDLIPEYGAQFMAGQLTSEAMQAILADTLKKYPEIEQYYKYLGAHQFGELEQETVKITVAAFGDYGGYDSGAIVLNLTDTRTETEIKLNSGVTVVYGQYTAEQLMQLILDGVYANGEKIDGLTVKFEKNVIGLPAGEGITVTVQFKGDRYYKPSESTVTITIEKAPVTVTVDNQVVKYGDAFNKLPVTTNPANVDLIQFIVGLDISGVNINGGIKGLNGKVQLLLPKELQDTLAMVGDLIGVDLSHGATIKLSNFEDVLEKLDSLSGVIGYEEYLSVLSNMLGTLPVDSITDIADLEITIGGSLPTDAGVYLIGAVTADANYETAFGVGVLVLYPDGIKADIAWNQDDSNYIITNSLLASGKFDLGAHAFQVGQDGNLADATAQIMNLFLGVDIEGNLVFVTDGKNLNVGAYVELALIVNWGNQIYYSNILVRPIIVVAESLDVDFADQNGTVNNDRHFEFDNTPQSGMQEDGLKVTYKQDGNGYKAGDAVENYTVRYYYVGVQTNGTPYYGTVAPTHAGVYAITAVVIVYDADGSISHAGQKIGVLVIEPSKSNVTVDNSAIKYEDGKVNYVNGLVKPSSVNVPGLKPDTTIISVGLSANLDAINGLSSINGTVNIDLPRWLDEVLQKYNLLEAGYDTGITAGTFVSYIETLKAKLADLGIDAAALDKIAGIVNQIPVTTNLTFKDNVGYTKVGAYLIIAVVTDSDHYPSAAAGVMVIYPDATKVDLGFDKTWDDNNVFTQNYLNVYDLNAKAYLNGALHEDASALVTNIFVGFADDGRLILTKNKAELDNGIYAQVAFLLDIGNELYYAEPISRVFVIVPNGADVDFVDGNGNINNDRHFEFNNNAHTMGGVRVELVDGTVLTNPDGIDIFYIGVQTNGKAYASKDAPVHAGVYEVIVQYTGRDAQNRVVNLGANIGTMVIEPSKSEVSVDNDTVVYEEGKLNHVNGLVKPSSVNVPGLKPDTTIISVGLSANLDTISGLSSINGTVNVDLPGWLDALLEQYGLLEAGRNAGITAETFLDYINRLKTELAVLGTYSEDIVGALDKLAGIVEELPISTKLTFKDNAGYTEVGAYLIIAIVTDSDHYPSVATGFMVIKPNTTKVELNWSYSDSNNIFTWHTLNGVDLDATANKAEANEFVENVYFGFTAKGEFIFTQDWTELDNGVYCQIAFVADFGNEAYYAEPIGRVFAIVPTPADIVISDGTTEGDHFEFTYNGNPQGVNVSVSVVGTPVDLGDVSIKYVGVMSNGELYESTVAPTRAGVYAVSVTYVVRDGQGRIVTLGEKIATFIIKPAMADVDVENKLWESNGNAVDINGMITATPNVGMTVITSAIKTDGTFSENWLGALTGSINIDLPDWADALLLEVGFTGGSVAGLIAAIDAIEAKFDTLTAELGLDLEIGAFDAIRSLLNQMDRNLNVTINDTVNPSAIGTYLVMAIVTDPNYLPAIDAGVLVIYPKANEVDLNWNYNDGNDIFSMGVLGNEELMGATPSSGDSTVKVVYIGFDLENMKLIITENGGTLATGTYIQLAYLVPALDSEFDYAKFLARPIIAVPNTHEVEVTVPDDAHEDVDYEISIEIDGQDRATATGTITITYVGVTASGELYESETAPTKAGIYVVTVTYLTRDGNGNVNGMGADVTTLVITGHVDENTDHKCDFENCTKDDMHMDGHVDLNKDHVCDYGCSEAIGDHEDVDTDHACDYGCQESIGTCEDTDFDHACDYGCDEYFGEHKDDDTDHACDYGCQESIGACEDTDFDHACDYGCDRYFGEHKDDDTDHACDYGCQESIGACEDTNLDHACDYGCDRYFGEHKDDDTDHECDYGCQVSIGACEDTDFDHACDYGCGADFGTCEDTDFDHECDYGCGAAFGTCEDTDFDHECDYGCGADFGTCEDTDFDHACDYGCDRYFGVHEDVDTDHVCDYGCQVSIGACEDTDFDHVCDYGCGADFGTCEDTDFDHECDYGCGADFGICEDSATDDDHVCDYGCGAVLESHTGGTATCTKRAECDVCGEEYGELLDHSYGRWTITTTPTKDTVGMLTKKCGCGHPETYEIPVLNDEDYEYSCTATCGYPGTEKYVYVKDGQRFTFTLVTEALGHDYDIVKHETEDYYLRQCHNCGYFDENYRYQFGGTSRDELTDEHLVTEELQNNDRLNSVEKIEQVLKENLEDLIQSLNRDEHLSATLYDVTLRYWDASVNDFVKADRDHFPADGKMTVTIPLNGIVSDALNIYVIHLFAVTDPAHGTVAGEYETFTVGNGLIVTIDEENNQTLLTFTVSGLSPMMIGFGCVEHVDEDHDHKCDHVGCTYDAIGDHKDTNQDHVCDYGCSEAIGDHAEGTVVDHKCEYCGEDYKTEEHKDTNQDHVCDYGCSETIGDHEDADADHKCDYCGGGAFGEHKDDDTDHVCDYGCQVTMGTCADADKDHDCDYGCNKYFGEHVDANKNHVCDYGCQVAMGTCVDADKDHDCDYGCDKYFGEHKDADKNHVCDYGCQVTMGTCEDADKDHDCDYGCDKYFGAHVDTNKNHVCDYGCQVTIGTCEDADKDHDCDYGCDKYFGEHKDADKNHVCDYGCQVTMGTCADGNKDHACDYGCDKYFGEHVDADKNHVCDYGCQVTMGTCADADKDHDCDYGCDKNFGEHKDNDKDHNCEYCDAVLSDCTDTDKDHKCDICGTVTSSCEDSINEHICDICGRKLNACVDGNKDHECDYDGCTNDTLGVHADPNHDHKCDYCGGVMSACAEGNVIDHKCDYCGKGSLGGAHAEGSVIDHKCDYCGKGSFGIHAEGDVIDHKCDYCGDVMSACVDNDKNHVCDVCGVALDECVDENKDNVCDVCGEAIEEDKTAILILLMLLIVLMVVFCTGTMYCLVHPKKTSRAVRRATNPVATVAKKTVAPAPVVVLKAEATAPVAEVKVETAVEVSEEEVVLPEADAKAEEAVAVEDTAAAEIAPATEEKVPVAKVKKGAKAKKLVKIAKKGAPVAFSAFVAAITAVVLYKAAKKKQKSKIIEMIIKFFR